MIFSVGYQQLTPAALAQLARDLRATVIDVRSVPRSRKPGFNRSQLQALLGHRYESHPELGGRIEIAAADLRKLAERGRREHLLLLCLEHACEDCHRYHEIALPLLEMGVEVGHIHDDHVVDTSDFAKCVEDDSETYLSVSIAEAIQEATGA